VSQELNKRNTTTSQVFAFKKFKTDLLAAQKIFDCVLLFHSHANQNAFLAADLAHFATMHWFNTTVPYGTVCSISSVINRRMLQNN